MPQKPIVSETAGMCKLSILYTNKGHMSESSVVSLTDSVKHVKALQTESNQVNDIDQS